MTTKSVRVAFFSLFALAAAVLPASAQATRTWVSGVGDDVNPCSRTAPCKTFAGAISKTAVGGYINAIDDGNYGAVTITKSITIDGGGSTAAISVNSSAGITVNTAGGLVTIRNLAIENTGTGTTGINIIAAASVQIENVSVRNFTSFGINYNPSDSGAWIHMQDVQINNISGGAGIYIRNGRAAIDRTFVSNSQSGIVAGSGGVAAVKGSVVTTCGMGFAAAYASTAVIDVQDSTSTDNDWGVVVGTGAIARVGNSTITDSHSVGLYNDGSSTMISFGNNRLAGNIADGAFTSTISIR